jgi:hypothetical protein
MEHDGPYRTSAAPNVAEDNEPRDGEFLGLHLFLLGISLVRLLGSAWTHEAPGAEGALALLVVVFVTIPIRDMLRARARSPS